jgi:hypothetical protein
MAILTVGAHGTAADRVVHYAAFVPYRPLLGSSMFNQFSRRSRSAVVANQIDPRATMASSATTRELR